VGLRVAYLEQWKVVDGMGEGKGRYRGGCGGWRRLLGIQRLGMVSLMYLFGTAKMEDGSDDPHYGVRMSVRGSIDSQTIGRPL
jgi:N-methylhydantoinase B/oxoprolinase/acetone carboxylase alpha subunit